MDNSFATFAHVIGIIEIVNSVAGMILNFLLLYAIVRFSRPSLGTYRYLLTIFTLLDFYLVVIHVLVHPRVLRVDNIHTIVSDTIFDAQWVTAFWVGCQSLPFTLLGIHFLYRYWSVRRPHLIPLFSNKYFVALLVFITLGGLASWHLLCAHAMDGHDTSVALSIMVAEYERKYGKRIVNSWILMDQWRDNQYDWNLIAITLIMDIQMIISLSVSCAFAVLTFTHIKNSYKMSVQMSELQRKLLVTLCAQSAVPILCVYWPYVFAINGSFLNIPGNLLHDLCAPVLTFFPVWDPVIVILLFNDYRNGLLHIVRKPPPVGPSTMQVTTTFANTTSIAPSSVTPSIIFPTGVE